MTQDKNAHIEPSTHSTIEVDDFLRQVEHNVDIAKGAGSPAIKPTKDLGADGKPVTDTQDHQGI